MKLDNISPELLQAMKDKFGEFVTTKQISSYVNPDFGVDSKTYLYDIVTGYRGETPLVRVKRGLYKLEIAKSEHKPHEQITNKKPIVEKPATMNQTSLVAVDSSVDVIETRRSAVAKVEAASLHHPKVDKNFVPFGVYGDVLSVLKSDVFAPMMIVGDSGNGKTLSVLQAVASLSGAIVPVSMDSSVTEQDLIGHYGLVDGNTVYEKGPVRIAAETGSVLLLDELDRANPETLICLNMLLDGYPVFDKKTGDTIYPKAGFKIVATANTKGQGDDTDRFVTAGILDEAFLERFPMMFEQEYPTPKIEEKILKNLLDNVSDDDAKFIENLVKWANSTRKSYKVGAIENFITTRRLAHIVGKNYRIFKDRKKAVTFGVGRFQETMRDSFIQLYDAIDGGQFNDD